jgi:hypothetical protein
MIPAQAAVLYALDDGTHENSLGLGLGGTFSWANRFSVAPGGEYINSVSVYWDANHFPAGSSATVVLLTDPNNDGNPSDAITLGSQNVISGAGYVDYTLASPVYVGASGANFFAGVIVTHASGSYPAALDESSSAGRSWLSLTSDLTESLPMGDLFPGNLMVRATSGSLGNIPEPATLGTMGAGLLALFALRRRR